MVWLISFVFVPQLIISLAQLETLPIISASSFLSAVLRRRTFQTSEAFVYRCDHDPGSGRYDHADRGRKHGDLCGAYGRDRKGNGNGTGLWADEALPSFTE